MPYNEMSSLRRRPCSPATATAPPLEDDDLLSEILVRLSPQPSSIPRASAVCKRWRGLVSNPRFRLHHRRSPPLLGCFVRYFDDLYLEPTMESPDRVPLRRFSSQSLLGGEFRPLGCRNGLVLIYYLTQLEVLVWDPVNGSQHRIALPPGFDMAKALIHIQGAVLRTAADAQHFQVVLVGVEHVIGQKLTRVIACVYSSENGGWGDLISTPLPPVPSVHGVPTMVHIEKPNVLVGDSLYWLIPGKFFQIVEFDMGRQSLAVTAGSVDMYSYVGRTYQFSLMRADDGGLGFLALSDFSAQLWKRKTGCDCVASWVLVKTIELDKLLSLNLHKDRVPLNLKILGFAEENNVVFLSTILGIFMIQLESLQSKKISENNYCFPYHPFESVYAADTGIGAEPFHGT